MQYHEFANKAIRRRDDILYLPSKCGSFMRPFQPTVVLGFSKYTRITIMRSSSCVFAISASSAPYSRAAYAKHKASAHVRIYHKNIHSARKKKDRGRDTIEIKSELRKKRHTAVIIPLQSHFGQVSISLWTKQELKRWSHEWTQSTSNFFFVVGWRCGGSVEGAQGFITKSHWKIDRSSHSPQKLANSWIALLSSFYLHLSLNDEESSQRRTFGSWIEHGPTTTNILSSSRLRIFDTFYAYHKHADMSMDMKYQLARLHTTYR